MHFKLSIKESQERKNCKSDGDPHMDSYYNWKYEAQLTGEYPLYEHNTLPYKVCGMG